MTKWEKCETEKGLVYLKRETEEGVELKLNTEFEIRIEMSRREMRYGNDDLETIKVEMMHQSLERDILEYAKETEQYKNNMQMIKDIIKYRTINSDEIIRSIESLGI